MVDALLLGTPSSPLFLFDTDNYGYSFESVAGLLGGIEEMDVEFGEYVGFDRAAHVLELVSQNGILDVQMRQEVDELDLRQRLERHFDTYGPRLGLDFRRLPLSRLVRLCAPHM